MKRCLGLAVAVAVLAWATAAEAQVSITGTIAGTVMDITERCCRAQRSTSRTRAQARRRPPSRTRRGVRVSRSELRHLPGHGHAAGFQTALYNKVVVESGRTTDIRDRAGGRRPRARASRSRARSPVLEMTSNVISSTLNNKDVNELPLAGRNAFTLRASHARRGRAARHGQHALQRHARRNDQPDNRRRQQLLERLQERRHELLRHGAGPARRRRTGDGRDRRPRRRRRRHGRREPEVHHAPRHEPVHGQLRRAVPHGQTEREHVRQRRARHPQERAAPPRFRRQLRRPGLRSARTSCSASSNYEVEWIPQTQTRTNTILHRGARQGIFRYTTAAGEQRTVNVYQMAAAAGLQSTPDPTIAALLAKQASARQYSTRRAGHQPPHGDPDAGASRRKRSTTSRRCARLPDRRNLSFMTSYNRRNQDSAGPARVADPGLPDQHRHVRRGLVGVVDGDELDDQLRACTTSCGSASSTAATRTRSAGRRVLRAERHRQRLAGAIPAAARVAARRRQRAGHRQALHHDHHRHADDAPGQPHAQVRRQLPGHPVARSVARRCRERAATRPAALQRSASRPGIRSRTSSRRRRCPERPTPTRRRRRRCTRC